MKLTRSSGVSSQNEQDLQKLQDVVGAWRGNWGLVINKEKSKVMHCRRIGRLQSTFNLTAK